MPRADGACAPWSISEKETDSEAPLVCGLAASVIATCLGAPAAGIHGGAAAVTLASAASSFLPFLTGFAACALILHWAPQPGRAPTPGESCCVCLEGAREVVCCPCGHAALCASCGAGISACPICRAHIVSLQILYSP